MNGFLSKEAMIFFQFWYQKLEYFKEQNDDLAFGQFADPYIVLTQFWPLEEWKTCHCILFIDLMADFETS